MAPPRHSTADSPSETEPFAPSLSTRPGNRAVLVIGHQIDDRQVAERICGELESTEVWLVAPAFARNRVDHLAGDIDDQADEATKMARASAQALSNAGVTVAGLGVGDADPLLAIEDVLNRYPADRVLLVTHAEADARWAEADLFEKAVERFPLPIRKLALADGIDGPQIGETKTAEATDGHGTHELRPSRNLPPIPIIDAIGLAIGIAGTIVLAILAASAPGDFLEWPGSAQLALAIYSALVNLGHAVGLLLMDSVGFHRGPAKVFAWLSLVGTPIAIVASIAIALIA